MIEVVLLVGVARKHKQYQSARVLVCKRKNPHDLEMSGRVLVSSSIRLANLETKANILDSIYYSAGVAS